MQSVIDNIKKYNLIRAGEIIGVAVSGGSDSMSLLHFLNANKEKYDIQVIAIHFDHGIREESIKDAQFVEDYCRDNNIKLIKTRVNVPAFCEKKGTSIEMGARELRYNFFEKLLDKGIVDKVALAHHISDQAETILMHLFRGSGLTGAEGMSFVTHDTKIPNYNEACVIDVNNWETPIIRMIQNCRLAHIQNLTEYVVYQRSDITLVSRFEIMNPRTGEIVDTFDLPDYQTYTVNGICGYL